VQGDVAVSTKLARHLQQQQQQLWGVSRVVEALCTGMLRCAPSLPITYSSSSSSSSSSSNQRGLLSLVIHLLLMPGTAHAVRVITRHTNSSTTHATPASVLTTAIHHS
jgi:hypothetical protein